MLVTYRFRIKDANVAGRLRTKASAINQVWNYCGQIQNDSARLNRKRPSHFDLRKLVTGSSKLLDLHDDTINYVCKDWANRRDVIKKNPRWRISSGSKRSLGWIPFSSRSIKLHDSCLTYQKQKYRLWLTRKIEGNIVCGCFSEDASGRWYANIVVDIEEKPILRQEKSVGVDLGLTSIVTLSDGSKIHNPRHTQKFAQKLAKAQRAGRKKIAKRIHAKIKNKRKDYLHRVSTDLVRRFEFIAVGDISIPSLVKTRMAKSVYDAGWGMLRNQLRYKAMRHGVVYVEVDERYSSQVCSSCGTLPTSRPRGIADLRVRSWTCSNCSVVHDRDVNAALNILRSAQNLALQLTGISAADGAEEVKNNVRVGSISDSPKVHINAK